MAYLSDHELRSIGFRSVGKNVRMSDRCSIYNAGNISIGSNSRVDDFSILSAGDGGISIGHHVHISAGTSIMGSAPITLEDFSNVSLHCSVFSTSDDFADSGLINPTTPDEFRKLIHAEVRLERFSTVGANSVLLPGACIGEGSVLGVLSMVKTRLEPWGVYVGAPARRIKDRAKGDIEKNAEVMLERLKHTP